MLGGDLGDEREADAVVPPVVARRPPRPGARRTAGTARSRRRTARDRRRAPAPSTRSRRTSTRDLHGCRAAWSMALSTSAVTARRTRHGGDARPTACASPGPGERDPRSLAAAAGPRRRRPAASAATSTGTGSTDRASAASEHVVQDGRERGRVGEQTVDVVLHAVRRRRPQSAVMCRSSSWARVDSSVSGVRSSWLASATNRRWRLRAATIGCTARRVEPRAAEPGERRPRRRPRPAARRRAAASSSRPSRRVQRGLHDRSPRGRPVSDA